MLIFVESTNQTGEKKKNQIRELTANSTHISVLGWSQATLEANALDTARHRVVLRSPWINADRVTLQSHRSFLLQLGKREAKENAPLRKKKRNASFQVKGF